MSAAPSPSAITRSSSCMPGSVRSCLRSCRSRHCCSPCSRARRSLRVVAVAGTLVALLGVALMSRAPLRESLPLLSLLAAVGSALCIAQATVLVRRFPPVHPVTMNAVAMTAGAAVLIAGSALAGESLVVPQRAATWVALGYLVVVGSVVVFVLFLFVLRHWVASRTAYVYVLVPFITVALSAWLDDEPVGAGLVLGGLLVLTGVYVGALRPARTPRMPPEGALGPAPPGPTVGAGRPGAPP